MTSRQYKRKRFIKRIVWIALTAWPLPFIKLGFIYAYSATNTKTGAARHGSYDFDDSRFSFDVNIKKGKDEAYEKSSGDLQNPHKVFKTFRKLLVKHGYFTAVSGLMADYEQIPTSNLTEEFVLTIRWAWSQKNLYKLEYACDIWYPMEYDDRDRFEGFIKFLDDLRTRCQTS